MNKYLNRFKMIKREKRTQIQILIRVMNIYNQLSNQNGNRCTNRQLLKYPIYFKNRLILKQLISQIIKRKKKEAKQRSMVEMKKRKNTQLEI